MILPVLTLSKFSTTRISSLLFKGRHGRCEIGNGNTEKREGANMPEGTGERCGGRRASRRRAQCRRSSARLLGECGRARARRLAGELARAARCRVLHVRCVEQTRFFAYRLD